MGFFRILHLSDLHFGQLPSDPSKPGQLRCAHRFCTREGRSDPSALAGILAKDLSLREPPHVVATTGDLAWSGTAEDYQSATEFFRLLRQQWPNTAFLFVPGNHDVDRAAPLARQNAYVEFVRAFHGTTFDAAYPLSKDACDRSRLVSWQELTLTATGDINGADRLLMVGVNSVADHDGTGGPIRVSPQALEEVETLLAGRAPGEFRVFCLHHHLLPFAESRREGSTDEHNDIDVADGTIVGNSAKLQSWLAQHGFGLVLHGHKHKPHGRVDTLYRRDDGQEGRTILVMGAGSAGVYDGERGSEPLNYNVCHAHRLSSKRWSVEAYVQDILHNQLSSSVKPAFTYAAEVGPKEADRPFLFHAEFMDDCHAAIKRRTSDKRLLRTFMSVVDVCEYRHPTTTTINGASVGEIDVRRSFAALHPEFSPTEKWSEIDALDSYLVRMPERYQFQHGPRLFGIPHAHRSLLSDDAVKRRLLRPILRALQQLTVDSEAHAYVSLYRPDVDVLSSRNEPFPSLMSLQFLKDDEYLDLVATFRKIELSFWWVVNMLEAVELLRWAAGAGSEKVGGKRRSPRKITFFAALAEWKPKPDPSFVSELDAADTGKLTSIALATANAAGIQELIRLLEEKDARTNAQNLDHTGLERLSQILRAVFADRGSTVKPALHNACERLAAAAQHVQNASSTPDVAAKRCSDALKEAILKLQETLSQ